MSNWTRPDYVGKGSRKVPTGVDPETLAPDGAVTRIIPAAVLARRTPARVSTPTDLDDHLLPDAEPEGIVPRGSRP